jgi:hypothetical protein
MAKKTLAELVAEQNKLARATANHRAFKVVHVLVAARYNGPDLKAQHAKPGDVITVAGGGYADDLIASGMVEIPVEESEQKEPWEDGSELSMAELRAQAKLAGINSFRMSKAALIEALAKSQAESEEEPEPDTQENSDDALLGNPDAGLQTSADAEPQQS